MDQNKSEVMKMAKQKNELEEAAKVLRVRCVMCRGPVSPQTEAAFRMIANGTGERYGGKAFCPACYDKMYPEQAAKRQAKATIKKRKMICEA